MGFFGRIGPRRLALARVALTILLVAIEGTTLLAAQPVAHAQGMDLDYPIPGGWFFSQESRYPKDQPPYRGFTVVDDQQADFWTEFLRFGGVEVLGYPVSQRYNYGGPNGPLQQAFQRGILQWHPEEGHAELANVFDQFTEQGLDGALEVAGIPKPEPQSTLSFQDDAARRMTWLTDDRFLARYFFDPVNQVPFSFEEQAWQFFGLPQSYPVRPVYMREQDTGKSGAPLYLPYIVQRFQKGGMELFLEDQPNDPTIVPGDGKAECVSLTAVGRLARRLGSGTLIPSSALQPLPPENPPQSWITWYVPPLQKGQNEVQFELVGINFKPGEPVTIRLTPVPDNNNPVALSPIVKRVDHTDSDGSFDILITARVATYTLDVTGVISHLTIAAGSDKTIDLHVPTEPTSAASKAVYC